MRYLLAIAVLLASSAYGETTVGQLEPAAGTWRVYRGSTYVCTANSEAAALACAAANAETRRTTTRYQIRYPNRYATVTYTAPAPVCGQKPADLTQTVQCPTGTIGTWSQVKTHITAPYPQCWTQSAWTPATAPADACMLPLTAPAVTATPLSTTQIRVDWAAVTGASAYAMERCVGATCTAFAPLAAHACLTTLSEVHSPLTPSLTVQYRVRANRSANCSGEWGPYSTIVTATTPATPQLGWTQCATEGQRCSFAGPMRVRYGADTRWTEPREFTGGVDCSNSVFSDPAPGTLKRCETDLPVAVGTGTATLSWTAPTQNTDGSTLTDLVGFRISYGRSPDALTQSTPQIANPGVTSYVINNLDSGPWYFTVRAYTARGNESAQSSVATKVIQ